MRQRRKIFPSSPTLTAHAGRRCQQRGIRQEQRDAVFAYGDREQAVGGGCYRLMISDRRMSELRGSGLISAQLADRCRRLALITDGASIVTNYKLER